MKISFLFSYSQETFLSFGDKNGVGFIHRNFFIMTSWLPFLIAFQHTFTGDEPERVGQRNCIQFYQPKLPLLFYLSFETRYKNFQKCAADNETIECFTRIFFSFSYLTCFILFICVFFFIYLNFVHRVFPKIISVFWL